MHTVVTARRDKGDLAYSNNTLLLPRAGRLCSAVERNRARFFEDDFLKVHDTNRLHNPDPKIWVWRACLYRFHLQLLQHIYSNYKKSRIAWISSWIMEKRLDTLATKNAK